MNTDTNTSSLKKGFRYKHDNILSNTNTDLQHNTLCTFSVMQIKMLSG